MSPHLSIPRYRCAHAQGSSVLVARSLVVGVVARYRYPTFLSGNCVADLVHAQILAIPKAHRHDKAIDHFVVLSAVCWNPCLEERLALAI